MNLGHARPHLVAVPPAPDLSQRLDVLGAVVEGLVERTAILEDQRTMLLAKVEILERRATLTRPR